VTSADTTAPLTYEPPGPGSWELDAVHFPRPATRYWTEMHPAPFKRGFAEFTRYYGMLFAGREVRYVNGFMYATVLPVDEAEIPERLQRAEETFERKLWREQLRDWDETFKPSSIKFHRELQRVDPEQLSDEVLSKYLQHCRDHHSEMIYQHMRFTAASMLPTGDLLAHVASWADIPAAEVLELMRGAAPVSAGASGELQDLIDAIERDEDARSLLMSDGDPGEILASLRARDDEAGRAAAAYLDLVGYRLLDGFDISSRYALESPDALLRAIRAAVETRGPDQVDTGAQAAAIRERLPEEHRAEFDELLAEARRMYRLRDERGVFSDIWASGLMRRAALAAGRRLAAAGRIHEAEHMVDAGFDEMQAMLAGAAEPSADELAARHADRTSRDAKSAPPVLGPPPPQPPDMSALPPAAARVMGAMGIVIEGMFAPSMEAHEEDMLRGLAASKGSYEGPARRVTGPQDFDRIQQGDVLVTEATTEAFNILLPLLGGLVTDSGGLLSHAAIVAREYGIPGVVGTREATDRIADGARVRVDGDAGTVTVLP
jgi:phosphohistidine swiveling domain-containing protein